MANKKQVQIDIKITTDESKKQIQDLINQNKKLEQSVTDIQNTSKSSFSNMTSSIGGAVAALGVAAGAFSFLKSSINAAIQEESAIIKLNNTLKATGSYSTQASQDFQNFASGLEKLTGIANETILGQISLGKQLGYSNEQVKTVTIGALKLSKALGTDLETANQQLLATLNGNIGRLGKLSPALKNFTEEQLRAGAAVNYFAKSNTVIEAQGTEGSIAKMKVAYDDLQKAIGKNIIQTPGFIDLLKSLKSILEASEPIANSFFKHLATGAKVIGDVFEGPKGRNKLETDLESAKGKVEVLKERLNESAPLIDRIFGLDKSKSQLNKELELAEQNLVKSQKALDDFTKKQKEALLSGKGKEETGVTTKSSAVFTPERTKEEIKTQKTSVIDTAANEATLAADKEFYNKQKENLVNSFSEKDQVVQDSRIKELEDEFNHQQNLMLIKYQADQEKAMLIENSIERDKTIKDNAQKFEIENAKLQAKSEMDSAKQRGDFDKAQNEKKKQNQKETLATIATLAQSNNKTLAALGKAAGITQIAIDTPVAISKTLAAFPAPLSFVLAGAVGAAMAAQAANIAGIKLADGGAFIGQDGKFNGSTITGDKISANINAGETVLNQKEARVIGSLINSGSGNNLSNDLLRNIALNISTPPVIMIDGTLITKQINRVNDLRLV